MLFTPTWMALKIIILSEVSQRQISHDITHVEFKKKTVQMNLLTNKEMESQT